MRKTLQTFDDIFAVLKDEDDQKLASSAWKLVATRRTIRRSKNWWPRDRRRAPSAILPKPTISARNWRIVVSFWKTAKMEEFAGNVSSESA